MVEEASWKHASVLMKSCSSWIICRLSHSLFGLEWQWSNVWPNSTLTSGRPWCLGEGVVSGSYEVLNSGLDIYATLENVDSLAQVVVRILFLSLCHIYKSWGIANKVLYQENIPEVRSGRWGGYWNYVWNVNSAGWNAEFQSWVLTSRIFLFIINRYVSFKK